MSSQQTVIFVHIPKTAGTSLRNALVKSRKLDDPDPWNISDRREPPDIGWHSIRAFANTRRESVGLVMGHMPHGYGELFANPLFITVLRDPVERVLSSHFHLLRNMRDFAAIGDVKTDLQELDKFAESPNFSNLQIRYFLDYDIMNSTLFMSQEAGEKIVRSRYIGVSFDSQHAKEIRRIRVRQRRGGPSDFAVEVSNDDFTAHIEAVPASILVSRDSSNIEISLPIGVSAASWRIVPLNASSIADWYVVALEFWILKDGAYNLAAGGMYREPADRDLGIPSIVGHLPEGATPISSAHSEGLGPEHAFDGKNAGSVNDVDGHALTEAHLTEGKNNLRKFGAIGLVSDMGPFMELLRLRTGYRELELPHDNVGGSSNMYSSIDPGLIELIKERNRIDLEFYEYAKQLTLLQMREAGIPVNEGCYLSIGG